ncbi:MAG: MarR family transcriptional regulator [Hoeflea sp.]|nr:MarR family transcriptional regulator [Hoeflea sp.]
MSDAHEPSWPKERPAEARIVPGLFRSRNYIWDNDHRIVESHGVSWSQFLALSSLRSAVPDHVLSPTQLYTSAQVTSGGMTKMMRGLTKAGYIERVDNPDDKRSRLVKLTQNGAVLAETIVSELIATNRALIGGILSPDETELLADLLAKLSAGLNARKSEK